MTTAQKLAIAIAALSFLAGASTQLADIFAPFGSIAPVIVKEIVSLSGFAAGFMGIFLTMMTSQSAQIGAVQAMPGIDKIVVNSQANQTLATLAIAPVDNKVEVKPGSESAVEQTAKGT